MNEEYKWWKCKDCGHEVMSQGYPLPIRWSDGHRCNFYDATEELNKEMPEYVDSMKNITKGEPNG